MRRSILGGALAALLATTQHAAADNGSDAPSCKKAIAAISRQTGATVDHLSDTLDTVYLKQNDVSAIALFCSAYYDPFATVSFGNMTPPGAYYGVVAKVAAILFRSPVATFEAASRRCQTAAQKNDEGASSVTVGAAVLDCVVKKPDKSDDDDEDQGTTSISIGPKRE